MSTCDFNIPHKLLLRVNEACALLSMGRTSFYKEVASGRLHLTRAAGRSLVTWHDLEEYVEARRRESGQRERMH